jgi:hypothetical protein
MPTGHFLSSYKSLSSVNEFKNILDLIMQDFMYSLVEPPTHIRFDQKINSQ